MTDRFQDFDTLTTTIWEYRPTLWTSLVNSGRLGEHLTTIELLAERCMDKMLPQMMEAAGVAEGLKACDQLAWVGLVNNCKARVEEIILAELVYS